MIITCTKCKEDHYMHTFLTNIKCNKCKRLLIEYNSDTVHIKDNVTIDGNPDALRTYIENKEEI